MFEVTMRHVLSLLLLSGATLAAADFVYENPAARLVLGPDGVCKSLIDKQSGHDWAVQGKLPMFQVKKGGKDLVPSAITKDGAVLHVVFGNSGGDADVRADFTITTQPSYFLVELTALAGQGIDEIRVVQLNVSLENAGPVIAVRSNDQFVVSLMGFSDKVDSRVPGALVASVYPQFGMLHEKVAIIAVPTPRFYDSVQSVERDGHLPSPRIGGAWAKVSADARTSYLFTDLAEANVDETIRYAKLGGLRYILIYTGTWGSSNGSYPINPTAYPHGEAGLKAVIDKCHGAGLKVGMHMLTSLVAKGDPLVRPKPNPGLLKDATAVLAADIGGSAAEVAATGELTDFPSEGAFYGSAKAGRDIQIDDEIIQYRAVNGSRFLNCVRGFSGTVAAPHRAGATIHHLAERYSSYLADLNSPLKDAISDRVAGLINRCGFDMIYFDGGDASTADGPSFYYLGQQQKGVFERVKRDVLYQGAGTTPYSWHIQTRGTCDDFAAVGSKEYLDLHKIGDTALAYVKSFLPIELGWWAFLEAAPDHPATTPDEVEFYGARMLALDAPVSLETSLQKLKANGRTEEMLRLLGRIETLRLNGQVPQSVRQQLARGEWHMVDNGGRAEFHPVRYAPLETYVPMQGNPSHVNVDNGFEAQPLKFKLKVLSAIRQAGAPENVTLYRPAQGVEIRPPDAGAKMPGALGGRVTLGESSGSGQSAFMVSANQPSAGPRSGRTANLTRNRVLQVTLEVEGGQPGGAAPDVLNVQLETGTKTYRDYYIDLNFTGERTLRLTEPSTERMLPEFRPNAANYSFKAAMYGFRWDDITALNFRWMKKSNDRPVRCIVKAVEAVSEVDWVADQIELSVGSASVIVPAGLRTGDYAEFWADGAIRSFDANGNLLSTVRSQGAVPMLQPGKNLVALQGAKTARIELTTITLGPAAR
jgi:hypothetical protein